MEKSETKGTSNLDALRIANEIAGGFRELHIHENDLINHRFQWFGLLTGLLAATYGLLWEFKATSEMPMVALTFLGFLVAFSATLGSFFTRRAHDEIRTDYEAVWEQHGDLIRMPVRGLEYKPWWRCFLPWNFIFPVFAVFWAVLFFFTLFCDCPPLPK